MRINYQWTPEVAYAVGLIATDGCLSKDKRHIDLTSSDLQLLQTFKQCLSLNHRICHKKNGYTSKLYPHIEFSNVEFYDWLVKIGLTPHKSRTIGKLAVPDEYFRDFLRGHLDGDGSIFTYTDNYMEYKGTHYSYLRLYTTFLSASEKHMRWIQTGINRLLAITGFLNKEVRKNPKHAPLWRLKFAKRDSIKLLNWIYYKPGLPCLHRKKKIAETALARLKTIRDDS